MSEDIVARLGARSGTYDEYDWHSAIELEAAAEIERLRLRVKDLEINGPAQAALDEIERLRAELAEARGYATRLMTALWEKHYKEDAPEWRPLPDLMGVLTQIDNATTGLGKLAAERERCARLVVTWHYPVVFHDIAAAIRKGEP